MLGVFALDLAEDLIRERLQQAARDALADQLFGTVPQPPASRSSAGWLAGLALAWLLQRRQASSGSGVLRTDGPVVTQTRCQSMPDYTT
jgi:hypothetical protein